MNAVFRALKYFALFLFCISVLVCSDGKGDKSYGTMVFKANGEDFVRKGFTEKHGWHIEFDSLLVNISDPTAYIPDSQGMSITLQGNHKVDLAQGDEEAEPVTVGSMDSVPPGNWQGLKFGLRRMESGPYKGYSIVMRGTASMEGDTLPFVIRINEEMDFNGKEGYVGDEVKGVLKGNDTSDVEMTFHFDHIFGDESAPEDDHINTGSVGFEYFLKYKQGDTLDIIQEKLAEDPDEDYKRFIKGLTTLGHLGEGHCEVSNVTSDSILARD